ncbi:MAG: hypothetical protein ACSHW0_04645 [Thalassotalea sp.]
MKLEASLILSVVLVFQGCTHTRVKPENHIFQGETVPIKVQSQALANYRYIPIINSRSIVVSVFSKEQHCANNFNQQAKYLYSQELLKESPSKTLKLPKDKDVYIKVSNHWATPGAAQIDCFQVLSFKTEMNKRYELEMDITNSNFPRGYKCPLQIKAYQENKRSDVLNLKDLTPQYELFIDGKSNAAKCES